MVFPDCNINISCCTSLIYLPTAVISELSTCKQEPLVATPYYSCVLHISSLHILFHSFLLCQKQSKYQRAATVTLLAVSALRFIWLWSISRVHRSDLTSCYFYFFSLKLTCQ